MSCVIVYTDFHICKTNAMLFKKSNSDLKNMILRSMYKLYM